MKSPVDIPDSRAHGGTATLERSRDTHRVNGDKHSVVSPRGGAGVESSVTQPAKNRLQFLDWARGLAVVIMLQGHVFHSFTRPDLRNDGPYVLSQFLGGIGPAVFLVLTGITLAFLMDRRERQGLAPQQRWIAALRRAGYLFGLAFLFRAQLWIFAWGQSPWTDLFKVDVLNCMGLAILLMSVLALTTTRERVKLGAAIGAGIAILSPVVSLVDWNWLPAPIAAYIVPNFNYFALFPWAAFIAFGLSLGSILRLARPGEMNRIMQWITLAGIGLLLAGEFGSNEPSLFPKTDFWLNSPALICIKLGVVMLIIAASYLWNEYGTASSWSWVRQFGMTSLLVYWVHIELVYGRWFGFFKNNLTSLQCVMFAAVLIPSMLCLSILRTRWKGLPFPALFAPFATYANPRRASGD